MMFTYIVTAAHVARMLEHEPFAVALNLKGGGVVTVRSGSEPEWWYHPTERNSVDVAVSRFGTAHAEDYDIRHVPVDSFATTERIAAFGIGAGDEIYVAGLIIGFSGTSQRHPIVRIGNIAMIPGERIPVAGFEPMEAYLAEGRSIGGLSGSPVFVRNTLNMPVSNREGHEASFSGLGSFHFLGLMHGHWDVPASLGSIVHSEKVNMGISIIVPAHKILEVLYQPRLQQLQLEAGGVKNDF